MATLADVADHVDHVRQVAGLEHVGLGGDFDGTGELPDRPGRRVVLPGAVRRAARPRLDRADCGKLASGNILRVLRDAVDAASVLAKRGRRPRSGSRT